MYIAVNTLGFQEETDCSTVTSKKLIKEVNKSDGFSFTVLPEDPTFPIIKANKCCFVTAYDDSENEVVFRGRVTSANLQTDASDSSMDVTCEGPLGYLRDSVIIGMYIDNTKEENGETVENKVHAYNAIGGFMSNHNNYVDDELKFDTNIRMYGDPTNSDEDFDILKESHSFDGITTLDALTEILEDLDFECMVTYQQTIPHWILHISPKFGYHSPDPIVTGLNLKSLSEDIDGSELITSILPMGGVGYDEKRLMLGPVSIGMPISYLPYMPEGSTGGDWYNESQAWYANMYVDNDDLVSKWGRHIGPVIFDDIVANSADEVKAQRMALRAKACEYAAMLSDVEDEFDISAYDLYRAGFSIGALVLHNTYTVRDTVLGITVEARLTKQEFDYDNILESDCSFTVKSGRSTVS